MIDLHNRQQKSQYLLTVNYAQIAMLMPHWKAQIMLRKLSIMLLIVLLTHKDAEVLLKGIW